MGRGKTGRGRREKEEREKEERKQGRETALEGSKERGEGYYGVNESGFVCF